MYTNAEILSAVLIKWSQPLIDALLSSKKTLPFLANVESKIRSTGWVSQNWSMTKELSPIMSKVGGKILAPFVTNMLGNITDSDIPKMAHSICDTAIENGGIDLFEGNLRFSRSDMEELKRYLNVNMPLDISAPEYIVKDC